MPTGDSLRESRVPPVATVVDPSAGTYPTEAWQVTYFDVSRQGLLTPRQVSARVPEGLSRACPPVRFGQAGCIYAVRRWGCALRPSALEAAGFDPAALTPADDAEALRSILQAATFDLPGEFVIASPEHPFCLNAPDGSLRGTWVQWRTYLGALSFFVSGGRVDTAFIGLWAEARESYHQAVDQCLTALANLAGS